MGYAQDLIDEVRLEEDTVEEKHDEYGKWSPQVEEEVEAELCIATQQELEGNLSSVCAQKLIDSA